MRLGLLFVLLLAACNKSNVQKCDLGCRNYFKLHYWKDADAEIAAAPPEQRDAVRAQKNAEYDDRMMKNLDLCVTKCQSGADQKRVQCWIDATTAEQAEKCANGD